MADEWDGGESRQHPWRKRVVEGLADFVMGWPRTVVACAVVISAWGAWYATQRLTLDANTDSLISPDRGFMKDYTEFMREFGDLEYLYVAVDSRGNPDAARDAVDDIVQGLGRLSDLPGVHARIDASEQWRLASRAMRTDELKTLASASDGFRPLLESDHGDGVARLALVAADERVERLMNRGLAMSQEERERLGAGAAFLLGAVTAVAGDGFAFAQLRDAEYLVSSSGRMYFIEILPRKDFAGLGTIEPILKGIRGVIAEVQSRSPAVDIGLTGKPVLQADELATTSADMTRGTIIATILVVLLTMWTFRSVIRPILAAGMLALAFGCTYGAATLFVGRLNLLSLVFMLVLVGAGVDYGIHTIARYTEFRARLAPLAAMRAAMIVNTIPTWVGALTSAAVFFVALGTDFGGLQELGIIAGTGLILCAAIMTIVLPALLVIVDEWRYRRAKTAGVRKGRDESLERVRGLFFMAPPANDELPSSRIATPRSRRIIIACAIVTIALASLIPLLRLESNLLRLQADGLDSVAWEHRILDDSVSASWFGAVICRTEEETRLTVDRARAEPLVEEARSVLDLVALDTPERVRLRDDLARVLTPTIPTISKQTPTDGALTSEFVGGVRDRFNRMVSLASLHARPEDLAPFRALLEALSRLESKLADPAQASLARSNANAMVAQTKQALVAFGQGAKSSLRESLPSAVRDRFVSPEGGMLVSIFPKADLWDFEPLEQFVGAIRRIDPHATGVPMTVYESVVDMRSAFVMMSTWSLLIITIVVWIDLRSIIATMTCLGCLLIGMSWTFGALGLLGVSLNLANFFAIPMLLGFGIDSSVHVMHRAREHGVNGAFGWTMRAVALSAITTAVGFGTLLFAAHRGLQSLGWVMFVGSGACLICSVTLLPAALRVFPQLLGRPTGGATEAGSDGSGTTVTV